MTCLAVFLEQLDVTRDHDLDLFLDSLMLASCVSGVDDGVLVGVTRHSGMKGICRG